MYAKIFPTIFLQGGCQVLVSESYHAVPTWFSAFNFNHPKGLEEFGPLFRVTDFGKHLLDIQEPKINLDLAIMENYNGMGPGESWPLSWTPVEVITPIYFQPTILVIAPQGSSCKRHSTF